VVIPAYNEEQLIGDTLNSIPEYIDKVYVVDDGSVDDTWGIIREAAEKRNSIIPIQHDKNSGVGAAIISGYRKSLGDQMDVSVVMGGDNQMDSKYIPNLIEPIIEGRADYTKGNRLLTRGYTKGMSSWRLLGNSILTLLTKFSSGYWSIMDPQNGYTAISRNALETIDIDSIYTKYGYCNDILAKLNVYRFKVMDISIPARYGDEKSKIKYYNYILKVSWLLMKDFFWRLKTKYILISPNPIVRSREAALKSSGTSKEC
jgi:glycosyltransferase involved in cell wall biosynthesis